jgi:hypothetical protein
MLFLFFTFHQLRPLASPNAELTSEAINYFRYIAMTPWMADQPIARRLPMQGNITHLTYVHASHSKYHMILVFEVSKLMGSAET